MHSVCSSLVTDFCCGVTALMSKYQLVRQGDKPGIRDSYQRRGHHCMIARNPLTSNRKVRRSGPLVCPRPDLRASNTLDSLRVRGFRFLLRTHAFAIAHFLANCTPRVLHSVRDMLGDKRTRLWSFLWRHAELARLRLAETIPILSATVPRLRWMPRLPNHAPFQPSHYAVVMSSQFAPVH